jgi:hypothetical protein
MEAGGWNCFGEAQQILTQAGYIILNRGGKII